MSALDPSAPGLPIVPSGGGGSLPVATGAGQVPSSTGAGRTYAATALGTGGPSGARPAPSAALVGHTYLSNDSSPMFLSFGAEAGGEYSWVDYPVVPAPPANLLANAIAPNTFVVLDSDGDGTQANATTARSMLGASTPGAQVFTGTALQGLAALGLADVMGVTPGPTWSAVSGSGTAALASAQATLTLATGVAPGSWSLAPKAIAATSRTYYALDARARLNSITGGDNTNTYVSLRLCTSGSDNTGALANLRCDGNLALVVQGISGGGTVGSPVTLSRGDLTGGNLWLRLMLINAGRLVLLYGIGVDGAEPLAWTEVANTTVTLGWSAAVFSHATVALDAAPGGSADDVAVVWSDVSVRGLS